MAGLTQSAATSQQRHQQPGQLIGCMGLWGEMRGNWRANLRGLQASFRIRPNWPPLAPTLVQRLSSREPPPAGFHAAQSFGGKAGRAGGPPNGRQETRSLMDLESAARRRGEPPKPDKAWLAWPRSGGSGKALADRSDPLLPRASLAWPRPGPASHRRASIFKRPGRSHSNNTGPSEHYVIRTGRPFKLVTSVEVSAGLARLALRSAERGGGGAGWSGAFRKTPADQCPAPGDSMRQPWLA